MGLREKINSGTYWVYDRSRHKRSYEAATEPAAASDFASLRGEKYAVLVTYRADGTAVPTPVWFGLDDAGLCYVHTERRTAKVRRIRRDPRARLFASDARGKPLGPAVDATARIIEKDTAEAEHAEASIKANYGAGRRLYESALAQGDFVYLELTPVAAAP